MKLAKPLTLGLPPMKRGDLVASFKSRALEGSQLDCEKIIEELIYGYHKVIVPDPAICSGAKAEIKLYLRCVEMFVKHPETLKGIH